MKYEPETIGDVVFAHIKENFVTQQKAAKAWGCSSPFINHVVQGKRKPSEAMLKAIGYQYVEAWLPQPASLPAGAFRLSADSATQGLEGGK